MGIFGKRKSREERAAEIANKVASGKGFYGRTTRAFVGGEDFAKLQGAIGAYNSGANVQQLLAMGAPTTVAVVVSISDTGQLVNFDPVVDLVVQPAGATDHNHGHSHGHVVLRTIVSKLAIPRAGDQVLLVADPAQPGGFLYAGMV
ncbi:hypothetical protein OIE62_22875 [Streptomyces scopuliridis]|uniref:Uncharacterized protein n=1 Tax=Streptomyces scopuliridis TaxID=452529 RepID=A0ACD4ZKA8_9ACTN|nr:hypothetical protein [Streptomyces scopuliridis]WSB34495.1 hypothetical protein OG949_17525 [Streptomyces scopuliridis]WSB98740.1 hypothetical protein OG835_18070 [Streptomyces scopuliridis]WSC07557.1 hypothetical protein OIE62_22875 [Streptomyces scopuliridis]